MAHAIAVTALLLTAATARAGDEDCHPIPVTWYSPTGIAGCTLDGPTDGIASTYPGDVAAANWCTYPWDDCGSVVVQSHDTGLTITVPVAMYCDCYTGTAQERLVDLTPGQVAALGLDRARGLFHVTVTPVGAVSSAPRCCCRIRHYLIESFIQAMCRMAQRISSDDDLLRRRLAHGVRRRLPRRDADHAMRIGWIAS